MHDFSQYLSGPLGIEISIIVFLWGVLMFFAPFFWYGTNNRTREISKKMDELIAIQRKAHPE